MSWIDELVNEYHKINDSKKIDEANNIILECTASLKQLTEE